MDPSWLDSAFLGCPDFPSRGPKTLQNKHVETPGLKTGRPQNAKSNHDGSNPPILCLILALCMTSGGSPDRKFKPNSPRSRHARQRRGGISHLSPKRWSAERDVEFLPCVIHHSQWPKKNPKAKKSREQYQRIF